MKKGILLFLLFVGTTGMLAQDALQKELFSTDMVLKYRSEIDLTPQQIKKVKSIHGDNIEKFNSLKWDLDAEQVALNKALEASKIDEKAALKTMDKIASLESELKCIRLEMMIQIKNELKPHQQEQLKKLRTKKDNHGLAVITSVNEDPRIVIRGNATKDGVTPLYVIVDNNGERTVVGDYMQTLDPDVIESVSVLKGKAAIKKYGKEGGNGVVVITLKN